MVFLTFGPLQIQIKSVLQGKRDAMLLSLEQNHPATALYLVHTVQQYIAYGTTIYYIRYNHRVVLYIYIIYT